MFLLFPHGLTLLTKFCTTNNVSITLNMCSHEISRVSKIFDHYQSSFEVNLAIILDMWVRFQCWYIYYYDGERVPQVSDRFSLSSSIAKAHSFLLKEKCEILNNESVVYILLLNMIPIIRSFLCWLEHTTMHGLEVYILNMFFFKTLLGIIGHCSAILYRKSVRSMFRGSLNFFFLCKWLCPQPRSPNIYEMICDHGF